MIKVNGAFATRWREEWETAERMTRHDSSGCHQRAVELFLDAMKYEIAKVIFPEVVTNGEYHPPKAQAAPGPHAKA